MGPGGWIDRTLLILTAGGRLTANLAEMKVVMAPVDSTWQPLATVSDWRQETVAGDRY